MTNRHGLDVSYFKEKLGLIIRDLDNWNPAEMSRALKAYSSVAAMNGVAHAEEKLENAKEALERAKEVANGST